MRSVDEKEDEKLMAAANLARQARRNSLSLLQQQQEKRDGAAEQLALAKREVAKAHRVVKRSTKAAIKHRGATYVDPRGTEVPRTFTAAAHEQDVNEQKQDANEQKQGKKVKLVLTYDSKVQVVADALAKVQRCEAAKLTELKHAKRFLAKAKLQVEMADMTLDKAETAAEKAFARMVAKESQKLSAAKEKDFGRALTTVLQMLTHDDLYRQLKLVFLDKSGRYVCMCVFVHACMFAFVHPSLSTACHLHT
jgi:hypothetical protein